MLLQASLEDTFDQGICHRNELVNAFHKEKRDKITVQEWMKKIKWDFAAEKQKP